MKKNNSLLAALSALKVVTQTLFKKMPVLFLVVVYLVDLGIRGYLAAGFSTTYLLGMLILTLSIGIYVSTRSFSETTLSFVLGMLTIYSIDWKKENISLFIILYLAYIVVTFCISSVLKDGEKVAELNTEETNEKEVIRLMVGREYSDFYQRERKCHGDVCLELKDISGVKEGMLNNAYIPQHVSLKVEEGEVLGIAGLVGAGRTELVRMIFGEMPIGSGEIFVQGEKVQIKSSRDAIKLGMAWVTEDRKQEGLILEDTLVRNLSLPTVHKHRKAGIIDDNFLTKMSEKYIQKLKVKTTGGLQKAKNLSGGNQQKIVLGKWLSTNPKILILDEPTRGIDVGAKAEIYKLINELTAQGMAIVLISSELPEVMGMSDRLLIMYEGRVTGQLLKEEYTEERVMEYATGRKVHNE